MIASIETTVKVTLEMSKEEAEWLMNSMRNPLLCPSDIEVPLDREMRKGFFKAIDSILNQDKF